MFHKKLRQTRLNWLTFFSTATVRSQGLQTDKKLRHSAGIAALLSSPLPNCSGCQVPRLVQFTMFHKKIKKLRQIRLNWLAFFSITTAG
jgi:hypothetical protein